MEKQHSIGDPEMHKHWDQQNMLMLRTWGKKPKQNMRKDTKEIFKNMQKELLD